jgi:aminodeoxyfutalosine deaminase
MTTPEIEAYLRAVPKAELHLHLEGAIQPETLLKLAHRNGVELPAADVEGLRKWFMFRDFPHFADIYRVIIRCLRAPEDFELMVYELGSNLASQHVRYAEVTTSASSHVRRGIPFEDYFAAITRGRERAKADFGIELRWVFDIVRDYETQELCLQWADYTTGIAIEGLSNGVVALGLAGKEVGNPAAPYAPFFERARAAGVHSDPHAGETDGPHSVWSALRDLRAERIGHGVHSIEDPELVAYLAEHKVALEICPTSNIALGEYGHAGVHPLAALYNAGVPVTINSDDPPLFNTNINAEVALLSSGFGLAIEQIDEILLNGVRYSFLPPDKKAELEAEFREEMAALKAQVGL